jgi:NADPH:quinone reductase-like Zn-dependent oxidoreductase
VQPLGCHAPDGPRGLPALHPAPQLPSDRGYRTVNVVRREDAVSVVRETGGDVVLIDGEDLAPRVALATDGAHIHLGIDAVGGAATGHLADCVCESATLVSYGRMSGEPCAVHPDARSFATSRFAASGWRPGFGAPPRSGATRSLRTSPA